MGGSAAKGGKVGRAMGGTRRRGEGKAAQGGLEVGRAKGEGRGRGGKLFVTYQALSRDPQKTPNPAAGNSRRRLAQRRRDTKQNMRGSLFSAVPPKNSVAVSLRSLRSLGPTLFGCFREGSAFAAKSAKISRNQQQPKASLAEAQRRKAE